MSNYSEQKRQIEINETTKNLSAQDRYRARVEQRETDALTKEAEKNKAREAQQKQEGELSRHEELGTVDEYEKYKADQNFRKLADYLEIGMSDFDEARNALDLLINWTMQTSKAKDILDVMGHLKRVKNSMGFKEVGMTGLKKLYTYARLDLDDRRIQKEIKLLKERK